MGIAFGLGCFFTSIVLTVAFMKFYIPARERGLKSEVKLLQDSLENQKTEHDKQLDEVKNRLKKFEDIQEKMFDDYMNARKT